MRTWCRKAFEARVNNVSPRLYCPDEIRNEIEVMKKLEHPNVVFIKEYFVQSGKFYIVMDWLKGGELLDALLDLGNYTVRLCKKNISAKHVFCFLLFLEALLRSRFYVGFFGAPRLAAPLVCGVGVNAGEMPKGFGIVTGGRGGGGVRPCFPETLGGGWRAPLLRGI